MARYCTSGQMYRIYSIKRRGVNFFRPAEGGRRLFEGVTDMHTTVHAPRTKDHALIIGPNIHGRPAQ